MIVVAVLSLALVRRLAVAFVVFAACSAFAAFPAFAAFAVLVALAAIAAFAVFVAKVVALAMLASYLVAQHPVSWASVTSASVASCFAALHRPTLPVASFAIALAAAWAAVDLVVIAHYSLEFEALK